MDDLRISPQFAQAWQPPPTAYTLQALTLTQTKRIHPVGLSCWFAPVGTACQYAVACMPAVTQRQTSTYSPAGIARPKGWHRNLDACSPGGLNACLRCPSPATPTGRTRGLVASHGEHSSQWRPVGRTTDRLCQPITGTAIRFDVLLLDMAYR